MIKDTEGRGMTNSLKLTMVILIVVACAVGSVSVSRAQSDCGCCGDPCCEHPCWCSSDPCCGVNCGPCQVCSDGDCIAANCAWETCTSTHTYTEGGCFIITDATTGNQQCTPYSGSWSSDSCKIFTGTWCPCPSTSCRMVPWTVTINLFKCLPIYEGSILTYSCVSDGSCTGTINVCAGETA
jgi:hypothetical protein